MAGFEVTGLDDLIEDLNSLDLDRIAPLMLEAATPTLENAVQKHAAVHHVSGDMQSSMKASKPKKTGDGHSVAVRPTGTDRHGVRNVDKAAYVEFGTSKQKASPFLSPAVNESEEEVCRVMQEVFEREVNAT